MSTPKMPIEELTALITVYHRVSPTELDQALESLWSQTRPAAEVVLVEDGPLPDALEAIVVKHEAQHPNLRVKRCAVNRGSGPASQEGFELVRTDWAARLDADDIAVPERFQRQWELHIEKPELGVIGSALAEFEGAPDNVVRVRQLPQSHEQIAGYAKMNSPVNNPSSLLRVDMVRAVGGYRDVPLMEDYDLWVRLLAAGVRFENMPEPLVKFRADGMFGRRSAQGIFAAELRMQRTLVELGLIGRPRALFNLLARTAFRLLPTAAMSRAYKHLFLR